MKIRQQVLTIDGERYDLYVDAEQFGDATVHYDQDNVDHYGAVLQALALDRELMEEERDAT
jgi:hypothetical protein